MDMLGAFKATIDVAEERGYGSKDSNWEGVSLTHFKSMLTRIEENPEAFSEAKLGRWLGYIQGVLVGRGCLYLGDCKNINKAYAEDSK